MLVIKREQFQAIEAGVNENLAAAFFLKLTEEGYEVKDKEVVLYIINDAMSADIEKNDDIYEYAKIAVLNRELLTDDKPSWAKNILYSRSTPEAKIGAMATYISKTKKTGTDG